MKVQCKQIFSATTGAPMSTSPWLTIGRVYTVLAIEIDESGIKFRFVGDDGQTPSLHRAVQFDLVEGDIPTSWVVHYAPGGVMELGPAAWAKAGFWEAYFDGDSGAQATFNAIRREMEDDEGLGTLGSAR